MNILDEIQKAHAIRINGIMASLFCFEIENNNFSLFIEKKSDNEIENQKWFLTKKDILSLIPDEPLGTWYNNKLKIMFFTNEECNSPVLKNIIRNV